MTTKPNGITPEEIASIRERAERASEDYGLYTCPCGQDCGQFFLDFAHSDGRLYANDAEFIVHAREDIPKLLAEIERLRTALEEVNRAWDEDSTDYDFAMKVRTILDKSGFRKGE